MTKSGKSESSREYQLKSWVCEVCEVGLQQSEGSCACYRHGCKFRSGEARRRTETSLANHGPTSMSLNIYIYRVRYHMVYTEAKAELM